jgi:hypothetical protein
MAAHYHWAERALLVVGVALALGSPSPATPTLDATNNAGPNSSALTLAPNNFRAQSFTVNTDGLLTTVDVQVGRFAGAAGDVRFELRPLIGGSPTTDDEGIRFLSTIPIASIPVITSLADPPPYVSVDVSSAGIHAKPGDQYVISLRRSGTSPNAAWRTKPNNYAGGNGFFRSLLTSPWSATTDDYGFQTWIDPTPTAPYKLRVDPTFDMQYRPGTTTSTLIDGEDVLYIGGSPGSTSFPEQRPIVEYPITGLPANAVIQGAHLELDWNGSSGSPRIEIMGYAGDGLGSFNDITAAATQLAITGPTSAASSGDLPFDASYLASLVGNATHFGVRLRSLDLPQYVGFYTSEDDFLLPPRLVISYTLPQQMPGDFNQDSRVDASDYVAWRKSGSPQGYTQWRANFGGPTTGGAANAASVPEPAAVALLVVCAVAVGGRSWPRRRN